ncbi:MAG: polysaccharide deacetylase family protein [Acidobacteriia bacterium]|nr:polysaccharide deacetylase family protein [Terriglobia bacterium]
MKPLAIMYHDIVEEGNLAASGFSGAGADIYKLDRRDFAKHLEALRAVGNTELRLTFDDGGVSAYTVVAGMLEQFGWRGYFFITTDRIGQPGFLSPQQIRELNERGHKIGSHSCSHPARMSHVPWEKLLSEWELSTGRLAAIVGRPVKLASVPGGYYTRRVAEAAAQSGIETLFTSEPTARVRVVNGCQVLGRYVIRRGMGPEWPAGLAAGKLLPRFRQALLWKIKSAAKGAGGDLYLRTREAILKKV